MGEFQKKLGRYLDARQPILLIDTFEDDKAEEIIEQFAKQRRRKVEKWSLQGFKGKRVELKDVLAGLVADEKELENKILVLKDMQVALETPEVVSALKYLAQQINKGLFFEDGLDEFNIVMIAPFASIPRELEAYTSILSLDYLGEDEIREEILLFVKEMEITEPRTELMDKLLMTLRGLTETEIFNILELVIAGGNTLDATDLALIREQKQQMIRKSGLLEMIHVKEQMKDIGGLEVLKGWLEKKANIFANVKKANDFGVITPKGVLIVGMSGCGKSLAAKAASKAFDLPLLRMDMGRLMGKYVGESEANMRRAIQLTEASSPCILWIDELEKAFAGIGSGGSEVTMRLFGNFLTWMQEKESMVFVIATANDITKLPPELLRKGRFDEIFYVNLPNETEREQIFKIHIGKKHEQDLRGIDMATLVSKTKGYCGADIESVVHDGLEIAFLKGKESISTEDILEAVCNTHPISETMKDSLDRMAKNYKERKFKSASR